MDKKTSKASTRIIDPGPGHSSDDESAFETPKKSNGIHPGKIRIFLKRIIFLESPKVCWDADTKLIFHKMVVFFLQQAEISN